MVYKANKSSLVLKQKKELMCVTAQTIFFSTKINLVAKKHYDMRTEFVFM